MFRRLSNYRVEPSPFESGRIRIFHKLFTKSVHASHVENTNTKEKNFYMLNFIKPSIYVRVALQPLWILADFLLFNFCTVGRTP
jgi:hypothetical protein